MRSIASVYTGLMLVACSSAATLPLGGPYGGAAGDAGVSPGGDLDAGFVFNPGDSGSGSSSGIVVGSSSGTGTTVSSSSSRTSGSSSGAGSSGSSSASTSGSASSGSGSATTPTWTYLYTTYLSDATTTIGDCDGTCHYHAECSSATACFTWIGTGTYGPLSNGGQLFTWDNGYMPKSGPTSEPQAEADFAAWMAAGSLNN